MANKEHRYYDDEERGSKNFGDYDYSKKTLRATDKGRIRVVYGNVIINVD